MKYADRQLKGRIEHAMGSMEFGWRCDADKPGYDVTITGPDGDLTDERFVPVDIFAATVALLATVDAADFNQHCYKVIRKFWDNIHPDLRPIP